MARCWDGRQHLVRRRSRSTEDPVTMGSRPESEASPYGLRRGQTTLDMCRRDLNRSLSADAAQPASSSRARQVPLHEAEAVQPGNGVVKGAPGDSGESRAIGVVWVVCGCRDCGHDLAV